MTIYYNPAYSTSPYRDQDSKSEFGNIYCGDSQLLQRLLFYAGIPYTPSPLEERVAHYHTNIQCRITPDSPFYKSFETDSAGLSRKILQWRDSLVEVGWNMESYKGDSIKLSIIRDMEPESMPRGEADYWYLLLAIASERRILNNEDKIVVSCAKEHLRPHIAHIITKQQEFGLLVEYRPTDCAKAEGNLRKIQTALRSNTTEKIVLDANDDTFSYVHFATEDDALRYVATTPATKHTIYYSSRTKLLDNTLRLVGKPTVGSLLESCTPQVAQLFSLGNGLFEYPLNMKRIIEWLNMPISPMNGELCKKLRKDLSNALTNSGGILNEEWNQAIEDCLAETDPEEAREARRKLNQFLPLPQSDKIDIEHVKSFNSNLCKWASGLLNMADFPYNETIREQITSIRSFCTSLIKMLDNAPEGFSFIDLQLWCKNIAQPGIYSQYNAELESLPTISSMGDIHDVADSVTWVPAEDIPTPSYPFEMLNDSEYKAVEECGAMLYSRSHHSSMNSEAMLRLILNTKSLTIIETDRVMGEKTARHPLVLQLDERIKGGLKSITQHREICNEALITDRQVINYGESDTEIQLGQGATLKERHERMEEKRYEAESYTSLESLIQHPFTYVCQKCAKLQDYEMPSADDLNRTLGNVAHLMIEKAFRGRSIKEAEAYFNENYNTLFDESVNEKGLLLQMPEHAISLRQLKLNMRKALKKLHKIIMQNNLEVVDCEYEFKASAWAEAGEGVMLSARTDMLLSDKSGGYVIFDFKYSNNTSRKRNDIEQNLALQLELYRFIAKQEFGNEKPVRVAYVMLPEVNVLTADEFFDIESLRVTERKDKSVMTEAALSYRMRWKQLHEGRIERVEGYEVGTGEYGQNESEMGLFPLKSSKKVYDNDIFNLEYNNLK